MDKTRLSPGEYRVTEALPNPFVARSSENQGAGQGRKVHFRAGTMLRGRSRLFSIVSLGPPALFMRGPHFDKRRRETYSPRDRPYEIGK
jgi:hypothetical protein